MPRSMSDGMHALARIFGIACVTEVTFVHIQNHAVFKFADISSGKLEDVFALELSDGISFHVVDVCALYDAERVSLFIENVFHLQFP